MTVREGAVEWIEKQGKGSTFEVPQLYSYLESAFPGECDPDVLTPDGKEPKWHKDARWAIQDCKRRKTIKHIGSEKSGQWQRI